MTALLNTSHHSISSFFHEGSFDESNQGDGDYDDSITCGNLKEHGDEEGLQLHSQIRRISKEISLDLDDLLNEIENEKEDYERTTSKEVMGSILKLEDLPSRTELVGSLTEIDLGRASSNPRRKTIRFSYTDQIIPNSFSRLPSTRDFDQTDSTSHILLGIEIDAPSADRNGDLNR